MDSGAVHSARLRIPKKTATTALRLHRMPRFCGYRVKLMALKSRWRLFGKWNTRQMEYIDEAESGDYRHMKEEHIAQWTAEFLRRPRRTATTILEFCSPNAPVNRFDIIRGLASGPK